MDGVRTYAAGEELDSQTPEWEVYNLVSFLGLFILAVGVLLTLLNAVISVRRGRWPAATPIPRFEAWTVANGVEVRSPGPAA